MDINEYYYIEKMDGDLTKMINKFENNLFSGKFN